MALIQLAKERDRALVIASGSPNIASDYVARAKEVERCRLAASLVDLLEECERLLMVPTRIMRLFIICVPVAQAIQAVSQYRFKPATLDNKATWSTVSITIKIEKP